MGKYLAPLPKIPPQSPHDHLPSNTGHDRLQEECARKDSLEQNVAGKILLEKMLAMRKLKEEEKKKEQAGAELCQAQHSLG